MDGSTMSATVPKPPHVNLEWLLSEEFDSTVPPYSSAGALRAHLRSEQFVRTLANGITNGVITEGRIRRLVAAALREFRPGVRFVYETALAALAVALETQFSAFADEYLHDLAAIRSREVAMASRVARESLRWRQYIPKTSRRLYDVTSGSADRTWGAEAVSPSANGHRNGWKLVEVQCA
jgi:hypothetical protein